MNIFEISELVEEWHAYANTLCDTTTPEWMELFRIMSQCVEQNRRKLFNRLFKDMRHTPVGYQTLKILEEWEIHLNLPWTIIEQLDQILRNEWNFLVYAYR